MREIGLRFLLFVVMAVAAAANAFALSPIPTPTIAPVTFGALGAETFTLSGFPFRAPVRVFFAIAGGSTREAFVIALSGNQLTGITPPFDIGRESKTASVYVLNAAGTASESRVDVRNSVTFMQYDLTPEIAVVSPFTARLTGGTRVTIFGSGFTAPVQLFIVYPDGTQDEVQVIAVQREQIVAIAPPSRSAPGPVDLRVVNIGNAQTATFKDAWRYVAPMSARAVGQLSGPSSGGTIINIEGSGFGDVVDVNVAGVTANVIRVSPTSVTVRTNAVINPRCSNVSGAIVVTNVDNGDSAEAGAFTYTTEAPRFARVPQGLIAGNAGEATIATFGKAAFSVAGRAITSTLVRDNRDGTSTYALQIPSDLPFRTRRCRRSDAIISLPLTTSLTVTNAATSCSTTEVLVIAPPAKDAVCESELPEVATP